MNERNLPEGFSSRFEQPGMSMTLTLSVETISLKGINQNPLQGAALERHQNNMMCADMSILEILGEEAEKGQKGREMARSLLFWIKDMNLCLQDPSTPTKKDQEEEACFEAQSAC